MERDMNSLKGFSLIERYIIKYKIPNFDVMFVCAVGGGGGGGITRSHHKIVRPFSLNRHHI